MCAYSNKCMPAPVEWWLILHDGSRLCSCCVHREVMPFFFFLSHILIDLVTKLQECSTRIRVFPLVLSTSPPTKLRQPSFSLSLFSSRAKRLRKNKKYHIFICHYHPISSLDAAFHAAFHFRL